MSTTFGVKLPSGDIAEIAHRSRGIRFLIEIAELLPDKMKVIPMDNTAQGIYTIGDIKKEIKSQEVK